MVCSWYAAPVDRFSRRSDRLKLQPTITTIGNEKSTQCIHVILKKLAHEVET
jgi:hypothetical protein